MRKQIMFAGAMLGVCFSTTALFAATNLVQNPSFEVNAAAIANTNTVPPSWVETQPVAQQYVTPDGHPPIGNTIDGNYYLQLGVYGQLQQYLSYTSQTGDKIHLQGYGRDFGPAAGAFQFSLYFDPIGTSDANENTGDRVLELDGFADTQTMTLFQGDYTVPASENGKMVGVYLATGPGFAGFDAISVTVTPAPEPASLSLFGAGAALLMRRRRARIA